MRILLLLFIYLFI